MNLYFELTYKCNLSCPFCFIKNLSKKDMSLTTYKRFLKEAQELKDKGLFKKFKITLSGGEPSLLNNISKFIQIGRSFGKVTLVSNGTNPKILGLNPDAFEISVQFDNFYKTRIAIVNKLLESKKIILKCVATNSNINNIKQLAEKYSNVPILVSPVKKVPYNVKPTIEQLKELTTYRNIFLETNCPAGRGFFVITPSSEVLSCFLTRKFLGKSLKEAIANSYRVKPFECETDQEYVKNLRCLK